MKVSSFELKTRSWNYVIVFFTGDILFLFASTFWDVTEVRGTSLLRVESHRLLHLLQYIAFSLHFMRFESNRFGTIDMICSHITLWSEKAALHWPPPVLPFFPADFICSDFPSTHPWILGTVQRKPRCGRCANALSCLLLCSALPPFHVTSLIQTNKSNQIAVLSHCYLHTGLRPSLKNHPPNAHGTAMPQHSALPNIDCSAYLLWPNLPTNIDDSLQNDHSTLSVRWGCLLVSHQLQFLAHRESPLFD